MFLRQVTLPLLNLLYTTEFA